MEPLINIITRVSRKNFFRRCYNSVRNQTYKNINHICTYETDDMSLFLDEFSNINKLKVPHFKRIPNLFYSYNQHDVLDDFVNPNYDFQQKLAHNSKLEYRDRKIPVEKKVYGEYQSTEFTNRPQLKHSPYNTYLKIAEKKLKDGWVFYLDDDDYFFNDNFISDLVEQIKSHNDDTIHMFKILSFTDKLIPTDICWDKMKSGHPFMLHKFGGSCYSFHTKYADYTVWDEWAGADYRTAKALEKVIPNKNFTDLISIRFKSHGGDTTDIIDY